MEESGWAHAQRKQRERKNFRAVRTLNFLVCGVINEPHLPTDGSIPNQFFCIRCDQRALATIGNNCGNARNFGTHTDQVLFPSGLMPRDWLPASEFAECTEARM